MYTGIGNYLHYKGGRYTVLGLAKNVSNEAPFGLVAEQFVIYTDTKPPGEALTVGCPMYARPLKEFDQDVPVDEHPSGRLPRFMRID